MNYFILIDILHLAAKTGKHQANSECIPLLSTKNAGDEVNNHDGINKDIIDENTANLQNSTKISIQMNSDHGDVNNNDVIPHANGSLLEVSLCRSLPVQTAVGGGSGFESMFEGMEENDEQR